MIEEVTVANPVTRVYEPIDEDNLPRNNAVGEFMKNEKYFNGGLGNVPLVFQNEYPRFMPGIRDPDRYA